MDTTHLTGADWEEFEAKHQDAAAWLRNRSLHNEWQALPHMIKIASDPRRKKWLEARYQELDSLYGGG